MRQAGVGEAQHLERAQALFVARQAVASHVFLGLDDLADAGQEPRVVHDVTPSGFRRPRAHGAWPGRWCAGGRGVCWLMALITAALSGAPSISTSSNPVRPGFHRAPAPFAGFRGWCGRWPWPRPPISCGGQVRLGAGEFLEGEFRDLGDDIVDGRLEAGGRDLGDVVVELVERVADGELGGDLGDGKPVAFEASAEERETRGFISITTMRPVSGRLPIARSSRRSRPRFRAARQSSRCA